MSMKQSRFSFWILLTLALTVVVMVIMGTLFQNLRFKKGPLAESSLVYIASGSGVTAASRSLKKLGAISEPWQFRVLTAVLRKDSAIRAGEFEIPAEASLDDILTILTIGEAYARRLVIPEGSSNAQIHAIIDSAEGLDASALNLPREGHLLPETYFYHYGSDPMALIQLMESGSKALIDELWAKRGDNFLLKSPEEVLVLASIIEEETALPAERPIIAAVFLSRLKKRMRLQTDPTVTYGITGGLPLDRALTSSDLKADTPYNTYVHYGLPPTAISNPGSDAIIAVFNPADVDFLYFVADGSGGHVFAKTNREHNQNVRKWRALQNSAK